MIVALFVPCTEPGGWGCRVGQNGVTSITYHSDQGRDKHFKVFKGNLLVYEVPVNSVIVEYG